MTTLVRGLLVLAVLSAITACAGNVNEGRKSTDLLTKYVESSSYTPFTIPRSDWGPGTVVNFEGGREQIVAFDSDCLKFSDGKAEDIHSTAVSLSQTTYSLTTNAKLEIKLAEGLVKNVKLAGAFEDKRVADVEFTLSAPTEEAFSKVALQNHIKGVLEFENQTCAEQLFKEGNFVINRILKIANFDISFKGTKSQSLSLDATLLTYLGVAPALQAQWEGKSTLHADAPRLVGFTLMKLSAAGGFDNPVFLLDEISKSDVSVMRPSQ